MQASATARSRQPDTYASIEPVDVRMVGLMRLILAASALTIIYIDPSEPDRLAAVTYSALGLYTLFSALLYIRALRHPDRPPLKHVHWLDAAWYLLLIALSSGTSSIFFFFFFFAILVASFRYGFAQGLGVTLVSASLFTVIGYLTAPVAPAFELNRFLLRPIYLLVLGYMIAYWGGREVTSKRRLAFLKEVNRLSNPRFGVDQTICSIMERLRDFYKADDSILLLSSTSSDDYFMRRAEYGHPEKALRSERVPFEAVRLLVSTPLDRIAIFNCVKRWWPLTARYRVHYVDAGGAALGSSLDLGASFTNAPGGTANWSFTGGNNYNDQSGSVNITINKAATITTVTCSAGPFTYNGSAHTPCTASVTGPAGLSQLLTVSYLNNINAGLATASASYGGATNYLPSNDSKNFTINKANATINVTGYTGYYDGAAHGASGTATGVLGENLSSLLNLGSTFTNVPGGTANWTFNSSNTNTNYNSASGTASIVIKAWTMTGFYQPVDMIPVGVLNTVKGGSTVPMKFELFVGTTEKTSVSDIKSFQFQEFTCGSASTFEAPIEVTTTGGTMLRYDTTAGQFIQNWQTPKTTGKCYQVRVTAQDGSSLDAFFKTR